MSWDWLAETLWRSIYFYFKDVVVCLPVYSVPTRCTTAELLISKLPSRTKRGSEGQVSSIGRQAATFSLHLTGPRLPPACWRRSPGRIRYSLAESTGLSRPETQMGRWDSCRHTLLVTPVSHHPSCGCRCFQLTHREGVTLQNQLAQRKDQDFYMWFMEYYYCHQWDIYSFLKCLVCAQLLFQCIHISLISRSLLIIGMYNWNAAETKVL